MKIWELKSSFDDYESFQLLNLEEDSKKYFEGKIDSAAKASNSWGEIRIKCVEEGNQSDLPHFWEKLVHQWLVGKLKILRVYTW